MEKAEAIKILDSRPYTGEVREALEILIPELKESRDEQIRKAIIKSLDLPFMEAKIEGTDVTYEEAVAWLEKQKDHFRDDTKMVEQKPAEWSEDDKKKIHFLSRLIEFQVKDDEYCFGNGRLISKQEAIEMLKSLRPSWKPSEEQMKALNALNLYGDLSYVGQLSQLISLYQHLKKLM